MSEVALRGSGALAFLRELEERGVLTPVSLDLSYELPFGQYELLLSVLGSVHRSSQWVIGDAVNYGEKVYGETYAQATELTGLAPQTLMNVASVCRRVAKARRIETLPFSVHALVASLPPKEQTKWLEEAERERWSRSQLKHALNGLPPGVEAVEEETLEDLVRLLLNTAEPFGDRFIVDRETLRRLERFLGTAE